MEATKCVDENERRFQEDLEKAQALSLETLALEKFRLQKLQEDVDRRKKHSSNIERKIVVPEEIPRSRPRPGFINSVSVEKQTTASRIRPPPPVQKRSITLPSVSVSVEDLVSFDSPPNSSTPKFSEGIDSQNGLERDIGFVFDKNVTSTYQESISNGSYQRPIGFLPFNSFPSFPTVQFPFSQNNQYLQGTNVDVNKELAVLDVFKKKNDNNLIDLTLFTDIRPQTGDSSSSKLGHFNKIKETSAPPVRNSVLEAFDPLLSEWAATTHLTTHHEIQPPVTKSEEDINSECSNSIYAMFDPFDYMYSPSECSHHSDPIYAAVIKTPLSSPPPLPPRKPTQSTSETTNRKYPKESIKIVKRKTMLKDADFVAFHAMVKRLRGKFVYTDVETNFGVVISPRIDNIYREGTSVKLVVHCPSHRPNPIVFTSDVGSTISHVILHVVCELDAGDSSEFILKVSGLSEYLLPDTCLGNYEYVHQCIKLDQDIELLLIPLSKLNRNLARTAEDDLCDNDIQLEDLSPFDFSNLITYDCLNIVIETLEKEMKKIELTIDDMYCGNQVGPIQTRGVLQALKAICALLGKVETLDISKSLLVFVEMCNDLSSTAPTDNMWNKPDIVEEDGDYSIVRIKSVDRRNKDLISYHCEKIRESVYKFIEIYSRTFNVNFELNLPTFEFTGFKQSTEILDPVLVHIGCVNRESSSWNHDEYLIAAQIYHGTRPVAHPILSKFSSPSSSFYDRIVFDCWLNFEGINICLLPRESRLVFVLYGRTFTVNSDQSNSSDNVITQVELCWTSVQFFDYEGVLAQGSYLLLLWPPSADKRLGPAPPTCSHFLTNRQPLLGVEFPCYSYNVNFPKVGANTDTGTNNLFDFDSLDQNTQDQLMQIIEQDMYTRPLAEDREVLWEKRHYLTSKPEALPKVLLAAHSWDYACLSDLHDMLYSWKPLAPLDAFQLLLPCFPDMEVRRKAVEWMEPLTNDEVADYLPQLVQALKHETYETSRLAEFLLHRSLVSPRVAHQLYWLLIQPLPSQIMQNPGCANITDIDEKTAGNARYYRRLQIMLRMILSVTGQSLRHRFMSQQFLVKSLYDTSECIKSTKESLRLKTLLQELESVHDGLQENPTCLPLKPSLEVNGIQIKTCSYFPSNTLPIKISFQSSENTIIPAIFKAGDDLQQDMLTIQIIRVMDKLWLKEGLDLKMVTFACVPTGDRRGIIEMVTEAETLRKIQIELGLTGSFKDRPIAEWLAKHNPSALEYERAVENFTASCAGYSVATYILGICDRHNDNIMLKTSGHMFHIDFGKFLGDAQCLGNFKRDRTPFVLTPDMAYVINGGDKATIKFHHFVDLCCQAFNIIRKHGNLLLNLFGLMTSSGIPGVTVEAVHYVQKALLPELSNAEAAATFARMIESSLKSWFTQFNFFLHNLAQLRFNGDHNDEEMLSFVPKTYSMAQEGRIKSAMVYGCQKRYDPEKYYVYIIKVERENQLDPTYLFRSYKEFQEFHQKICMLFPLAKSHSLHSSGLVVGRSNIKNVAEKRRCEIEKFLNTLFQMADEISHSDVVYTFFHPLLRDQQEASIHHPKLKERKSDMSQNNSKYLRGQLKISFYYKRGALVVMIYHAKQLPFVAGNQEPSTYVKVYLHPDFSKATKRKTKVIKRNCNPSFMEMLEYRMPSEIIQYRTLQATVWSHDTLQENEFLGGLSLKLSDFDLSKETIDWYTLTNIYR